MVYCVSDMFFSEKYNDHIEILKMTPILSPSLQIPDYECNEYAMKLEVTTLPLCTLNVEPGLASKLL